MGKRTVKVGVTGRYGTRYGANIRKRAKKLLITHHSKHFSHFTGKFSMKRQAVGIWKCQSTGRTIAGGAWSLHTHGYITTRNTIRRLREAIDQNML